MLEIILIRHGNTEYNDLGLVQGRIDNPLSEVGVKNTEKASTNFWKKNREFDKAYASPLLRAQQTAKIFLKNKMDYQIIDGLTERFFGEMEGKSIKSFPFTTAFFSQKHFDIETNDLLESRVYDSLMHIIEENYESKRIIIFAHSHTIKAVCSKLDPHTYDYQMKLYNLHGVKLTYTDNKFTIDEVNIEY